MRTSTTDVHATAKAQAEEIVSNGADIRPRLTAVVTQSACQAQQSGQGLIGLLRAVVDGAREGLTKALPEKRDHALRQVVDALGDGLSQTALAGQLAVQEAVSSSQQFANTDLATLRGDLAAVQELFTETVTRGFKSCKALTAAQVAAAKTHAERVAEHLKPLVTRVHDAIQQHPADFAREGLQAGVSMGQGAAGSLFQALGGMLQQAGDQLRHEGQRQKHSAQI